jgi:nitronate monooxygenase
VQRVKLTDMESGDFLNGMLEAERAGAKALVVYLDSYPRNSQHWKILRQVQADEAHNCALIGKLLEKSGTPYSHATGEFFEKAIAIKEPKAQIEFLVKGLRWAVKRLEESLTKIKDPETLSVLQPMRDSHLRSIAACEALVRKL